MGDQLPVCDNFLTQDHAVILPSLPSATSMDYIKAVAAKIGANQIHSIFKCDSFVKIYLKDRSFVRTVIDSGVEVAGVLINVDFSAPPCSRVHLSNVDPVIPDSELRELLACYGTFQSAIVHQKITGEHGFSHIEGSSRLVYLQLKEDANVPKVLRFVYDGVLKEVGVKIEMPMKPFKFASCQTDSVDEDVVQQT